MKKIIQVKNYIRDNMIALVSNYYKELSNKCSKIINFFVI